MFITINGCELINLDNIDKIDTFYRNGNIPPGVITFEKWSCGKKTIIGKITFKNKEDFMQYCENELKLLTNKKL